MSKIYKLFIKRYLSMTSSIALWPTVIALFFLLLAFFVLYFERTPWVVSLEKTLPFSINSEPENARLILNTIAAGTISLTVFSFSMVMIVLSQATHNLTPRVIPGLISDRMNQVVLGVYIGTILYTLILILGFKPGEDNTSVPILGILLNLLFSITCIGLFVYFIHSISRAIKPDTILTRIYKTTVKALDKEVKSMHQNVELEKISDPQWFELPSTEAGYLRQIEMEALNKIATENNMIIDVPVFIGKFVVPGLPFLRLSKDVTGQAKIGKAIQDCFIFSLEEVVVNSFETGLRQISEVGVKALSPGINDPGTALSAIDFLTLLFLQRMTNVAPNCLLDESSQPRIIQRPAPLDDLIYRFFTPIRTYGKADVMVVRKLLLSLQHLISADANAQKYTKGLVQQLIIILNDADHSLKNPEDRRQINLVLEGLKEYLTPQGIALSPLS